MRKTILWPVVLLAVVLPAPRIAIAKDFWQQAKENLSDAAQTVAPVVAPGLTTVIEISQGKKPVDAIKDTVLAPARLTIDGQKAISATDQSIEDAVKKVVGPDAAKIIEIVRLPEKIDKAVQITAEEAALGAVDKGTIDPAKIATIPFAALLQQAIDLYQSRAKPIPDTVQTLLSTTHTKETLTKARFTIDDNLGSLPGAINFLKEKSSDNFAVTIGNIIVFSKDPGLSNMHFWAHELQHTVQYRELGVDGFAAKYATHSADLEADAEVYGKRAETESDTILTFLRVRQVNAQQ